jgi:hypothetical protein
MIVKGFWHIYMINHWYSIVTDQLRILITSGLYDRCEEISIGCIGTPQEKAYLDKFIIAPYPKLKVKYWSERAEDYEFPTLELIEKDHSDYCGFYFHAKAVTKPDATDINHWRVFLNEEILNQWQRHYDNICNGYDVSSVNFLKSPDHFSGNFWWFNRRYVDTLPAIKHLNHTNRWKAEQWVCMNKKGNFAYPEFREPGDTVFQIYKHYE